MLESVKHSTATKLEGEIIIINDDKLLHDEINEKWEKAGHYVNDAAGMVTNTK